MNNSQLSAVNCQLPNRPTFPARAVITAGMPYGNKDLHFGHIGGVFVHADFFARFLRDRIGAENVLFVSGTDCYGSPISEAYRKLCDEEGYTGTLHDYVTGNHETQKKTIESYLVELNLFAASAVGAAGVAHDWQSIETFNRLYQNGCLQKISTRQFFDPEFGVLLNGRQVVGRCPIEGCRSEKGYADECDLGHQYMPSDLIAPRSALSGQTPEMTEVTNWYFKLEEYQPQLADWVAELESEGNSRAVLTGTLREFLKPPVIYIKKDQLELWEQNPKPLPAHTLENDETKSSAVMTFSTLDDRAAAAKTLSQTGIRFRTGKTLVPFRLTGDAFWGVPAPEADGLLNQKFWVWPESLWAPISFTKAWLLKTTGETRGWERWWCEGDPQVADDAEIYQFIGADNIYFYGLAEPAIWMALGEGGNGWKLKMPTIIANNHILFLNKKASSSGAVRPPMARELLEHYTPEQLRAHFLGLGLGLKSVSFQPKPFNPAASSTDADPALREGSLLTNVFNRAARSCFYTVQKHTGGKIPFGAVSPEVLAESEAAILAYEQFVYRHEYYNVINLLDTFIRDFNKRWSANMKQADADDNQELRVQTLIDSFHLLKVTTVLVHPIAPQGTEMIFDQLNLPDKRAFFTWDNIFNPIYDLMPDPRNHTPHTLEPRVDFFKKHETQV